jgi:hypothetical protein
MQRCRASSSGLRRAVRLQVGGRGAQEAPVRHDLARRQPRVRQVAEADAQVVGLLDEVDGAVRQLQLHFQLRVAQGELRQQGRDHRAAEARRAFTRSSPRGSAPPLARTLPWRGYRQGSAAPRAR